MQSDLTRRVRALESEVRLTRVVVAGLVALLLMGAARPNAEVRATRVVLVDAKGRECGQLAAGPHGGVLDLRSIHHGGGVGFHAEAGELRVREIHNDDMLYVGMLGTHFYGQVSVEPPASAQLPPGSSIELNALTATPALSIRGPGGEWRVGPEGPKS